jgi:uncharacterized protein
MPASRNDSRNGSKGSADLGSRNVNLFGAFHCIQAMFPYMLQRGGRHILLVTSMDGKIGLPPDAPYISAGFALTGFCEVMRQERRGTGISVTNVMSGRVDTLMVDYLKFAWISAKIPPGKVSREIIMAIQHKEPIREGA